MSKIPSFSPGSKKSNEIAFLQQVIDAGGHEGLSAQAARDRLVSIESRLRIENAILRTKLEAVRPRPEASGKAEQAQDSGYPYYFTAEEIRIGKGERK